MNVSSVTASAAQVFDLRFDTEITGWALVVVCERQGLLSIHSDWGSAAHAWPMTAIPEPTLRDFLARAEPEYVLSKLALDQPRLRETVLNAEATRTAMTEAGVGTADTDVFLRACEDYAGNTDMALAAHEHLFSGIDEFWDLVVREPAPGVVFWRDQLLPAIRAWAGGI